MSSRSRVKPKWSCPICTFINPGGSSTTCEACDSRKPTRVVLQECEARAAQLELAAKQEADNSSTVTTEAKPATSQESNTPSESTPTTTATTSQTAKKRKMKDAPVDEKTDTLTDTTDAADLSQSQSQSQPQSQSQSQPTTSKRAKKQKVSKDVDTELPVDLMAQMKDQPPSNVPSKLEELDAIDKLDTVAIPTTQSKSKGTKKNVTDSKIKSPSTDVDIDKVDSKDSKDTTDNLQSPQLDSAIQERPKTKPKAAWICYGCGKTVAKSYITCKSCSSSYHLRPLSPTITPKAESDRVLDDKIPSIKDTMSMTDDTTTDTSNVSNSSNTTTTPTTTDTLSVNQIIEKKVADKETEAEEETETETEKEKETEKVMGKVGNKVENNSEDVQKGNVVDSIIQSGDIVASVDESVSETKSNSLTPPSSTTFTTSESSTTHGDTTMNDKVKGTINKKTVEDSTMTDVTPENIVTEQAAVLDIANVTPVATTTAMVDTLPDVITKDDSHTKVGILGQELKQEQEQQEQEQKTIVTDVSDNIITNNYTMKESASMSPLEPIESDINEKAEPGEVLHATNMTDTTPAEPLSNTNTNTNTNINTNTNTTLMTPIQTDVSNTTTVESMNVSTGESTAESTGEIDPNQDDQQDATETASCHLSSITPQEYQELIEMRQKQGIKPEDVEIYPSNTDYHVLSTHVLINELKYSLKVLFGLARGAHIVKKQWLIDSMQKMVWQDESLYEFEEIASACVRKREFVANGGSPLIFLNKSFLVEEGSYSNRLTHETISELLQASGAQTFFSSKLLREMYMKFAQYLLQRKILTTKIEKLDETIQQYIEMKQKERTDVSNNEDITNPIENILLVNDSKYQEYIQQKNQYQVQIQQIVIPTWNVDYIVSDSPEKAAVLATRLRATLLQLLLEPNSLVVTFMKEIHSQLSNPSVVQEGVDDYHPTMDNMTFTLKDIPKEIIDSIDKPIGYVHVRWIYASIIYFQMDTVTMLV